MLNSHRKGPVDQTCDGMLSRDGGGMDKTWDPRVLISLNQGRAFPVEIDDW